VYAYYIWGGIVPLALALEEMGFNRYSSNSSHTNLLKKNKPGPSYVMITGDTRFSHDNSHDVSIVSHPDNKDGKKVKVILISKSGSEGLDFKNIRQIHVMDSWYTLNRIEQIIGRGVRTLSHCQLPFESRTVEIYLHASKVLGKEESADMYLYRYAEKKAIQLGKIYRILKETSVDCILNQGQKKMSTKDLNQTAKLNLSSGETVDYKLGDKPFTGICDYMENCDYQCKPMKENLQVNSSTYNNEFIKNNNPVLTEKIKSIYRDNKQGVFTLEEIVQSINITRQYPIDQIYYALTHLIQDKMEYLVDPFGRIGHLVNIENFYLFQPLEVTDKNASLFSRIVPVDYKRKYITVPEEYRHSSIMIDLPKMQEKNNTEESFETLSKTWNYLFIETETDTAENTDIKINSWSQELHNVLDELKNTYQITTKHLQKYFIEHTIDTFSIEQKLDLLNTIFTRESSKTSTDETIVQLIQSYFEMKKIEKTIILYDKSLEKNRYYSFEKGKWNEREKITFEQLIQDSLPMYRSKFKPKLMINDDYYYGFMTSFKNEVVFKVKKSAEKGTYVANGNRSYAVKIINEFLRQYNYDNQYDDNDKKNKKKQWTKLELSVILEIIMREKKLFLNAEQVSEVG
jgi:hypothetical protein